MGILLEVTNNILIASCLATPRIEGNVFPTKVGIYNLYKPLPTLSFGEGVVNTKNQKTEHRLPLSWERHNQPTTLAWGCYSVSLGFYSPRLRSV
jgi:hypothetical protein